VREAQDEPQISDRRALLVIVLVIVTAPGAVPVATDLSLLTILLIGLALAALVLPVIWLFRRDGCTRDQARRRLPTGLPISRDLGPATTARSNHTRTIRG
jgi:hypothetical protein